MIIVRLIGGLGNQLFQYAIGRNLSIKTGMELKLDISGFEAYKLHAYSLGHFNIQEKIATKDEIAKLSRYAAHKGKIWWLRNYLFADPTIYIKEKRDLEFQYDPTIMDAHGAVYLDGYWQNEKYFKDIEKILRQEFSVEEALAGQDKVIAESMAGTNAVSVHIRRGDYVTSAKTNAVHGTCDPDYYRRAAKLIAEKSPHPHFFVFSDDHEWVKNNIIFDNPTTYVAHNDASRNYQDLRLMSLCRHNIIANSSFSWWGAWLNANPGKIVIAPKQWVADQTRDAGDLIPQTWIKI
jgi:hypothetical protein